MKAAPELDILWTRGVLKDLDESGRELFARSVTIESFKGGQMVDSVASMPDDNQDSVVFVLEGVVRGYVESERRQVTLRYAAPGDAIGLFAMFRPIGKAKFAQAVTDSLVARITRHGFMTVLNSRLGMALAVLDSVFAIQDEALLHLVPNIFRPVDARIAAHLIELSDLIGADRPLNLGHQLIADSVGTAREVVSRALRRFADDGMLMRSPEGLVITDRERLAALVVEK